MNLSAVFAAIIKNYFAKFTPFWVGSAVPLISLHKTIFPFEKDNGGLIVSL